MIFCRRRFGNHGHPRSIFFGRQWYGSRRSAFVTSRIGQNASLGWSERRDIRVAIASRFVVVSRADNILIDCWRSKHLQASRRGLICREGGK